MTGTNPTNRAAILAAAFLAVSATASSQTMPFTPSTGADGALNIAASDPPAVVVFDPLDFHVDGDTQNPTLDSERDNVYHFTTITIGAGTTVRLTSEILGSTPVRWYASGPVQIDGNIDLDGEDGHPGENSNYNPAKREIRYAGAGGWRGGLGGAKNGGVAVNVQEPGQGPGGAPQMATGTGNSSASGAGHSTAGNPGSNPSGGNRYGNAFLLPLLGGSGGAGSIAVQGSSIGPGGGAGGGAFLLVSHESIILNGTISATGGAGTGGSNTFQAGSGGGSGGGIRLAAPRIDFGSAATLRARGGSGGDGNPGRGSDGFIRVEAFSVSGDASSAPAYSHGIPGYLDVPVSSVPYAKLLTVNGESVPASPTGSVYSPDVELNTGTGVNVVAQTAGIPENAAVDFIFTPESGPQVIVSGVVPAGTDPREVTVNHAFQHGATMIHVRADWTP